MKSQNQLGKKRHLPLKPYVVFHWWKACNGHILTPILLTPHANKLESGQKVESYLILNVVVVVVVASTVPKKLVGDFSAIFGFHERYTATMRPASSPKLCQRCVSQVN